MSDEKTTSSGNTERIIEEIEDEIQKYRDAKLESRNIEAEMKTSKVVLSALREELGENYTDDYGYIRKVETKEKAGYSNAGVDDLASVWIGSGDPVMKACGEMLTKHRKITPAGSYITVK